jgi:predicted DNA-binding transcriptional regulator AlpA
MNSISCDEPTRVVIDALLTVLDLERLLQIDKRSIDRHCRRGLLPMPVKLGGSNRWRAREIAEAIDQLQQRVGRKIEPVGA